MPNEQLAPSLPKIPAGETLTAVRSLFDAQLDYVLAPDRSAAETAAKARRDEIFSTLDANQRGVAVVLGAAFASGVIHLVNPDW